ncbi:hypothetical protein BANRA_05518 [Klebsiella pneumoniae]|nr:hypothetical protein BANRA_05518 [Klebsiella pneumoniae]
MDEKVFFHLSYETMLGDTEDFINACLERANRADCNDADAEIARHAARSNSGTTWRWRAVPRKTSPTGTICASPECSCALPQQNNVHGSSNNLPQAVAAAARVLMCWPPSMRNVRGRWRRGISSGCWSRAGTPRCTDRTCAPPAGAWKPRAGCAPARAEPAAGRRADGGRSRHCRTALPGRTRG